MTKTQENRGPISDIPLTLMVKFGQKEHLEDLQKGILYCKTVREFAKMEGDIRHDPNEGISSLEQMKDGIIEMKPVDSLPDHPWQKFGFKKGIFTTYRKGNIFCMSRFIIPSGNKIAEIELSPQFDEFGGHFLVVMNQPIFFDRLKVAIDKGKYNVSGNIVEYVNLEKHTGKRSPFIKDQKDSWQVEYRIYFDTEMEEPLSFEMGNISDITIIAPMPKNRKFQFKIGG